MERIDLYRKCVKHLLEEHSKFNGGENDTESEIFFDSDRDLLSINASRLEWAKADLLYCDAF